MRSYLAAINLLSRSFPVHFLKLITGERHFYSSSNYRRKNGKQLVFREQTN
jgi:hypothetical protein